MQEANNSVQRFHHWLQNDIGNKFSIYYFEQKSVGNDVSVLRNLLQMHSSFYPGNETKEAKNIDKKAPNIGENFWQKLKRVSVLVFYGDKRMYENLKADFAASIDPALAGLSVNGM